MKISLIRGQIKPEFFRQALTLNVFQALQIFVCHIWLVDVFFFFFDVTGRTFYYLAAESID